MILSTSISQPAKYFCFINFLDEFNDLPLNEEVKNKLIPSYKEFIKVESVLMSFFDYAAIPYCYLGNDIRYRRAFTKTDLGVIKNNTWVKEYFFWGTSIATKHLNIKEIAFFFFK